MNLIAVCLLVAIFTRKLCTHSGGLGPFIFC
jgi:hypothetical protein